MSKENDFIKITTFFLILLIFIGLFIQQFTRSLNLVYPLNLFFIILFLLSIIFFRIFAKNSLVYLWISSVKTSIVAISFFLSFILLMGIIPQNDANDFFSRLGLTNLVNSYPFALVYVFLMFNLGIVVANRITQKLTLRNIAFLFNHLGLFIILLFGGIGSYDFKQVDVISKYDETVTFGYDRKGKIVELPFAFELQKFNIDYYPPKIKLIKRDTNQKKGFKTLFEFDIDTIKARNYKNYEFKVLKFIPYSWWDNDSIKTMRVPGYVSSALIRLKTYTDTKSVWISNSSIMQKGKFFEINDDTLLILDHLLPKRYVSHLKILTKKGEKYFDSIEVNRPLTIMSWYVYPKDYNKNLGEYSDYIIFEANYDPWLNYVYVGIYMLIIGSLLLIVTKNK